jgi:hypothetical protein
MSEMYDIAPHDTYACSRHSTTRVCGYNCMYYSGCNAYAVHARALRCIYVHKSLCASRQTVIKVIN